MSATIEALEESQIKSILLRVLAWRVGDLPDLPKKLTETYSISMAEALTVCEILCPALDVLINNNCESADFIAKDLKIAVSEECKGNISRAAFGIKDKCTTFCLEHTPSLSRVLYHDWKLETQIATESLGRIARPVASIVLRIQPASKGTLLIPPLESVSMELSKDMIDALSSGFDRLQTQLNKIVQ